MEGVGVLSTDRWAHDTERRNPIKLCELYPAPSTVTHSDLAEKTKGERYAGKINTNDDDG